LPRLARAWAPWLQTMARAGGVPPVEGALGPLLQTEERLESEEFLLFDVRPALLYVEDDRLGGLKGSQGDAYFAVLDAEDWKVVSRKAYPRGPEREYAFRFEVLERQNNRLTRLRIRKLV